MNTLRMIERALVRKMFSLPPEWLIRLSGKPSIVIDGQRLHPEMQLLLATRRWSGAPPSLRAKTVAKARAAMLEGAVRYSDALPVKTVRGLTMAGPSSRLRLRHYAPFSSRPRPLLLFMHGGGFALGDLETHDLPCRIMCREAELHVLAVDYRLAPEHPFPAATEDVYAALRWARRHAEELGADPDRIAVGGDSAGGNLSAVVAQRIAKSDEPPLVAQLLIYPATDRKTPRASHELFGKGFLLEREDTHWFDGMYSGSASSDDPGVSPLLAADLRNLPPAIVVTAGFDVRRDEGEAYAEALREAGTQVRSWREAELIHGFLNCTAVSPAALTAVRRIAAELRTLVG